MLNFVARWIFCAVLVRQVIIGIVVFTPCSWMIELLFPALLFIDTVFMDDSVASPSRVKLSLSILLKPQ